MGAFLQDLRYGIRLLSRNPGFTTIAVLTLALGVGANTAIFSTINAVLLRPLPYKDSRGLVMLWTEDSRRGIHEGLTPVLTVNDWRTRSSSLSDLAVFTGNPLTLTGADQPERVKGAFVSSNLFPLLGVEPAIGQTFSAEQEDRGENVVVLSYGLWQRRFGGSAAILGKKLDIDGDMNSWKNGPRSALVIGVMPASFSFPDKETQLWEPTTVYWRWKSESVIRFSEEARRWGTIARLNSGKTPADAQTEMNEIAERLSNENPVPPRMTEFPGFAVNVVPLLDQITGKQLQLALWVLLGAVMLVLLIACVNVANLMLARGASRGREFAVRAALGASPKRLARQLITESAILACLGGLLGVFLASFTLDSLIALAPSGIPRLGEVRIDKTVLLFSAGASLLSGLLFGLVPAWKTSRSDPGKALKEGETRSSGGLKLTQMRGVLVASECALSLLLLIGAGLLIRSSLRLQSIDPGFNPENVLLARIGLPPTRGRQSGEAITAHQQEQFFNFADRIAALPGVQDVGVVSSFLIAGVPDETIAIEGRPSTGDSLPGQLSVSSVSPGFFETMKVPLIRGRFFTRDDSIAANQTLFGFGHRSVPPEAVVINQSFAQRFFPDEDPIGKRLLYSTKNYVYEIVGVVGDMHRQGLERESIAEYFVPYRSATGDLVVRTSGDPLAMAASIKDVIKSVEKDGMLLTLSTISNEMGALGAQRTFQTRLLGLFAMAALLLAMIGIYGVMQYVIAQRTHEIGIRVALGARSSDVFRLVVRQAMKVAVVGIGCGLIAAIWLADVFSHLLFRVGSRDPVTFVVASTILLTVAAVASYLPARRAMRVDPIEALRCE